MRWSWLLCVLFGTLAWGQAAAPPPPKTGPSAAQGAPSAAPADTSASVPATAPVLTIEGVCPPSKTAPAKAGVAKATGAAKATDSAAKSSPECKTIITRAQFEKLANSLVPNMPPQVKRQLESVLPRFMAMSQAAEKQGLDKTPQFQEKMKFTRMQLLTGELQRKVQDEASKISDQDVENYYKEHADAYEQYNLDRLFIPRMKQAEAETPPDQNEKLTEEQQKAKEQEQKAKQEQNEQEMTKLADSLRARAAAGEDILKLQKEAFEAAGMKIESPTVNLKVRKNGLPPAHAAAFDLKPGEVSAVISDSGGHYIYKLISKEELPLEQVKNEIHNTLQSQRVREGMDKYQNSFHAILNEAYFGTPGPSGPGMRPMPTNGPRPQTAPPATAPKGQAPAQPQPQDDEKPD